MTDSETHSMYHSFLLRCWLETPDSDHSGWRFALRSVAADPSETHFNNVAQLLDFISAEFTQPPNWTEHPIV